MCNCSLRGWGGGTRVGVVGVVVTCMYDVSDGEAAYLRGAVPDKDCCQWATGSRGSCFMATHPISPGQISTIHAMQFG